MDQKSIKVAETIALEAIVNEVCSNHTPGSELSPDNISAIASKINTRLKESTGVDFKVVVRYNENQPNRLVVGIG